jgi:thioesterase domain-containing protein
MLEPIQTAGRRPPLFFVHGTHGVMSLGSALKRILGPEQPIYAIHAEGIDGRSAPIDTMQEMVSAYVGQIEATGVARPIRIAGMCGGCTAAVEVARELHRRGWPTHPTILLDPSAPSFFERKRATTPLPGEVFEQLYQWIHQFFVRIAKDPNNDCPFDARDPERLHNATLAGVMAALARDRFTSTPFAGEVEVILNQAQAPAFFHPQLPWRKLFPALGITVVMPSRHSELVDGAPEETVRLVKFLLERESVAALSESRRETASV